MKNRLHRKRFNPRIILLFLLFVQFLDPVWSYAGPAGPIRSHVKAPRRAVIDHMSGNRLYFTPACPIIAETFNQTADVNGATSDPGATGWYLDATNVSTAATTIFSIKSHRFKAQTTVGEGIWYSQKFSIAGYTGIQVDAKISAEGTLLSSEYVQVYYKLDNGPETPINSSYFQTGNFGTPLLTSAQMTGSTVQLVIRIKNTSLKAGSNNPTYYIEQYDVFKETGPCTVSGITVAASASNSGVLTCTNPSTTLTASTTATGTTTYSWAGPNSFTATGATVSVSAPGTYTVTGTNSAGTGTATVAVTSNTTAPAGVTIATPGTLSCTATSVSLTASSTTTGTTFAWTGPNSFTGSGATVSVTAPGTYTVTATNPTTGCTATATTTVVQNAAAPAGVTATASGTLTCATTSVTLTGASSTSGVSFAWTGPNSFTGTGATVSVTAPGTYTVTVTNTATGCTATATTTVAQNIAVPASVAIATPGTLSCTTTSVALTASSTTTGTTFAWTGPNSFTGSGATVSVTAPGTYTVTATNPTTGCKATASTTVTQNVAAPAGVTATASGTLTCATTSVTLTGASSTSGVSFAWTGPNSFTGSGATVSVTAPGTYTVTVTNTATGCTATATTTVAQNIAVPASVAIATPGSLSCTTTSVPLTASSTTTGTTFAWTGPNSFTGSGATVSVTAPGTYTVTATNPTTGCKATASTTVVQNITAPAAMSASTTPANATLTCATNFINVSGSSTTAGVTYVWTGPNNFSVAASQTNVFNPGTYTLTATNPANGCTATATVTVSQNITPPTLPAITPSAATLTCANPSVTLRDSSTTAGVSYNWTGPNSYTATGRSAVVTSQGSYILTVTDPSNGCASTTTAIIGQNFAPPAGVTAINNGPLTCATTSVTLTGNSSTTGMTYSWTGPNGFTASGATATTSVAGTYTLTVTNPTSGCTAITNTVVAQNTTAPTGLSIGSSTGATLLTCTNTSISLTATSSVTGASYNWSGPNGFSLSSATITVTNPGAYLVTAIDPSNGCASNTSANVTQNTTAPANLLMASNPVNAVLTCSHSSILFTASSSVTGATYAWTGPNGFSTSGTTSTVTTPGTYTIRATDPANGCSSTSSAIVTQDTTRPSAVATSSVPANALLTCTNSSVLLTASSSTTGVTYSWTGPSSFTSTSAAATVTTAGNYTVTVTNPGNGCFITVTAATVVQNTTVPGAVSASASDKLSCNNTSVILTGNSTTAGVTYAWAGPSGFTSSSRVTTVMNGGAYTLTATDPTNGCSFSRSITVVSDLAHPLGVTATGNGALSCTVGDVILTGNSSTAGVTYTWTGPNGFFDPEQTTDVTDSGTYFLTVSNPGNGCTSIASVTVTADFTQCSAVAPKAATGHAAMLDVSAGNSTTPAFTYKVYPNPAGATAFIDLRAPVDGHVTVEVYNGLGMRERVVFDGVVQGGIPYHWTLDASRLTAGVHFCIIRTNNKSYTSKLLITPGQP